jgi:DNA-binding response OmpR family regulator
MAKSLRTVIILEDELDIAELMSQLISSYGAAPLVCRDRDAVAAALDTHDVALALLDIMLPSVDGRSIAQFLREQNVKFPVYFMTGIKPSHIGDRYSALADGILRKPFSINELRSILDRALATAGGSSMKREVLELMAAVASEQEDIRRQQTQLIALTVEGGAGKQPDSRSRADLWQEFGMSLEASLSRQAARLEEIRRLLEQIDG